MNEKLIGSEKNILFYEDENGNINVEVLLQEENVWLNADAIAKLFNKDIKTIYKYINNIYFDAELEEVSTVAKNAIMGKNGQIVLLNMFLNIGIGSIIRLN